MVKAFLGEAMALTGDLDNALRLIDEAIAQAERPGWEERFAYAENLPSKAGCSRSRATPKVPSGTFSPRSNGRGASRRKCGSYAHLPTSRGCGRAKAKARTRISCLP